jgi:tellurite resistance protein TehA-like permease
MGFGKISILIQKWPYPFSGMEIIAIVVWMMNIILFLFLLVASIVRYLVWPKTFLEVMKHPAQASLSFINFPYVTDISASFSIGLSTIIIMLSYVAVPKWGQPLLIFAEVLFWINAVISIITCFGIYSLM